MTSPLIDPAHIDELEWPALRPGGEDVPPIDDTDAIATIRRDLAEAEAERDAAQADLRERVLRAGGYAIQLAEAEAHIKALQAKLDALAPHGSCGCSYDTPGQVCQHHSPQLVAALARAEKAEAELSGFHSAMERQVTFISKIEAYLIHLAYSGEIDPKTENAVPWSEVARRHEARATAAEAEVARLTTKIDRMNEHGRCRDKRIRAQRAANRVTWQIVDQRRKWLGSSVARAAYIRHHYKIQKLEAEVARLAGLIAEAREVISALDAYSEMSPGYLDSPCCASTRAFLTRLKEPTDAE